MIQTLKMRILAMLLAVIMVVGIVPTTVFATETETEPVVGAPIEDPVEEPTVEPTEEPTVEPTEEPTVEPTVEPTEEPTVEPTEEPTVEPTEEPTVEPTEEPTVEPTEEPTVEPTEEPTVEPTEEPTEAPAEELIVTQLEVSDSAVNAVANTGSPKIVYTPRSDDYYKLISKNDYALAPGISESEIVMNNDAGTHRQVAHVVEVDIHNSYTKVMPSYGKMADGLKNKEYSVQIMEDQIAYAEANGYGNVVAAMNLSLSWYTGDYYNKNPHLIGEPLGYIVMDGEYFENSAGKTGGAQTVLVINFDEKDGVVRPSDIPKTEIRATSSAITGWEEQVIPANFGFLVKDGVNQYGKDHKSDPAPRSFVGIKADGSIVMVMNDGRQAPTSSGFNSYEMAEFMLSLGCVQAINGDGGGSSQFLSQRPGEDIEMHCSPSDGGARPTTHGILVISTAPSNGEFVRAQVSAPAAYYTPNSTVQFTAVGADLVGGAAEIPEEASWQLSDSSVGTIDQNGLFVSNGTAGTTSAQIIYNDEIVGEYEINIVIPDSIQFSQATLTVPNGKSATFSVSAKYGFYEVVTKDEDFIVELGSEDMGELNGYELKATEDASVTGGTIIAKLTHDESVTNTMNVVFGKASEVFYDFEEGFGSDWEVEYLQKRKWYAKKMSDPGYGDFNNVIKHYPVTAENGMVHDGEGAAAVYADTTLATMNWAGPCFYWRGEAKTYENVKSVGVWVYIPEDAVSYAVRFVFTALKDGQRVKIDQSPFYYGDALYLEESGWHYVSVDVSEYDAIVFEPNQAFEEMTATGYNAGFWFELSSQLNGGNSGEYNWQTTPEVKGINTFYIDNITIDYSEACEDKDAPIFGEVNYFANGIDEGVKLNNQRQTATVATQNEVAFNVSVAEDTSAVNATGLNAATAKAYIDGNEVKCSFNGSIMSIADTELTNGVHTVKFTIQDNAGNYASVIRKINIQGAGKDASVKIVPKNDAGQVFTGSQYWIDIVADEVEKIEKITATLNLKGSNEWILEHIETLNGFTTTYRETLSKEGIVSLTITRTGEVTATGEQVIASIPVQTWQWIEANYPGYYPPSAGDSDLNGNKMYDPYEFWQEYVTHNFDVTVDPQAGKAEFIDGSVEWFSGKEIKADTEQVIGAWWGKITAEQKTEFFGGKSSYHLHKAGEATDKAATCTEAGYIDRIFCVGCSCVTEEKLGHACDSATGCGAVLDWGTTVPAIGHTYHVVDGKLACDCGKQLTGTGLMEANGTYYYLISDKLQSGWQMIDDAWYYIDTENYAPVATLSNGVVTYSFEVNGELTSGQWHHTAAGSRYYYGPDYYRSNYSAHLWKTIDGKEYCFDPQGYCHKGYHFVDGAYSEVYQWYDFGEDGALIGEIDYTGVYELEGNLYYIQDGVSRYGMFEYNGAYYFAGAGDYRKAIINTTRACNVNYGLMPNGTYTFGGDGRMVDKAMYTVDGVLYYFEAGNICTAVDKVSIDGKDYDVDATGKVLYTGRYTDASGANRYYENGIETKEIKNGLIGDYFYVNDEKMPAYYGLVEYQGNYYYINDGGKIIKNVRKYVNKTNDLTFANGDAVPRAYFEFDAEGKMIVLNGLIGDTYYINSQVKPYYGLVKVDGDFYYVNDGGKIVKNMRKYVNTNNGLTFDNGDAVPRAYFEFDAEGKMIVLNGLIGDTYYINSQVKPYYGLVKVDGDFYYVNDGGKIVKNMRKYVNTNNGLTFDNGDAVPRAYFEFDAEGKMIVLNGLIGDTYYINSQVKPYYGLVKVDGDFYYVNDGGRIVKDMRKYVNKTNDLTFDNGDPVPKAYFMFDANGKMIID